MYHHLVSLESTSRNRGVVWTCGCNRFRWLLLWETKNTVKAVPSRQKCFVYSSPERYPHVLLAEVCHWLNREGW